MLYRPTVRRAMAGPVLAALAATSVLTGCAVGQQAAAPAAPQPKPSGEAQAPPPAAESSPRSSSAGAEDGESTRTPSQPAEHPGEGTGFGKCTAATLSMRVQDRGGEGPDRGADLFIANVGTRSCTVQGYPELKLINTDDRPTDTAAHPETSTLSIREIQPGQRVSVPLYWSATPTDNDANWGPCGGVSAVDVTPALTDTPVRVPWNAGEVCDGGAITIGSYALA